MKSHKNRALLAGASVIALGLAVGSAAQAAPLAVLTTPFTTSRRTSTRARRSSWPQRNREGDVRDRRDRRSSDRRRRLTLTNGGSFLINATATVPDTFSTAHATAKFDNGLIQTANNAGATATATITNTGTMTIAAQATGLGQRHEPSAR